VPLDPVMLAVGFLLGAGPVVALGASMLEDHPRRIVLPATIGSAVASGALVAWAFNYFVHFAQRTGP
jgi:membrane protein YqaA with SNARE-associated domain